MGRLSSLVPVDAVDEQPGDDACGHPTEVAKSTESGAARWPIFAARVQSMSRSKSRSRVPLQRNFCPRCTTRCIRRSQRARGTREEKTIETTRNSCEQFASNESNRRCGACCRRNDFATTDFYPPKARLVTRQRCTRAARAPRAIQTTVRPCCTTNKASLSRKMRQVRPCLC
ncbi:unnamed protein product [Xylocopa violacea]|uniref:Uncharacterized protein n=1 Tax=Xylocopa violacea TaxID=135666 RepID=A0ABP1P5S4_XYLVO